MLDELNQLTNYTRLSKLEGSSSDKGDTKYRNMENRMSAHLKTHSDYVLNMCLKHFLMIESMYKENWS